MLKLIRSWLRAGVCRGRGVRPGVGNPAGLADLPPAGQYRPARLGRGVAAAGRALGVLVRYADDFVVICPTRQRAEEARTRAVAVLAGLGFQLQPGQDQDRLPHPRRRGLRLLGLPLHKVESWRWRGRWYLQRWPSTRAMGVIRDKVRVQTDRAAARGLVARRRWWNSSTPSCGGGAITSGTATPPASSPSSTATSMSGWPSWPATSTTAGAGRHWTTRFNGEWLAGLGVYRLTGTVR